MSFETSGVQQERSKLSSVVVNKTFEVNTALGNSDQYFSLYLHRLKQLRPFVINQIQQKWKNVTLCSRVLDCQKNSYNDVSEVVIIGMCFKNMENRYSPLDALQSTDPDDAKNNKLNFDSDKCLVSDKDFLLIEDEYGSIKLSGSIETNQFLTGIVLGVKGKYDSDTGDFVVNQHLYCGVPSFDNYSIANDDNNKNDKYIAFVSGLEMGKELSGEHSVMIDMLFSYLNGNLLNDSQSKEIVRLVIAGNVLTKELPDEDDCIFYDKTFAKQKKAMISSLDSRLKELDVLISNLSSSLNIDIMPGKSDPSNQMLPQQSFHKCLFPLSSSFDTFNRVCNPHSFSVNSSAENKCKLNVIGTSGQNIVDMQKYSKLSWIECMELCLKSRCISPTSPDTLACFPFQKNDPFVLLDDKQFPNVFFCANSKEFNVSYLANKRICLLQIPSFVKTHQIVLLNIHDFSTKIIKIDIA